jgi:hypothetical protein
MAVAAKPAKYPEIPLALVRPYMKRGPSGLYAGFL